MVDEVEVRFRVNGALRRVVMPGAGLRAVFLERSPDVPTGETTPGLVPGARVLDENGAELTAIEIGEPRPQICCRVNNQLFCW